MTYDVHAHAVPPAVFDAIRRDGTGAGVEVAERDGRPVIRFAGGDAPAIRPDLVDVDARLAAMDRMGIEVQLVSSWIGVTGYELDPERGSRWARLFNETLAEMVGEHPDRFRGLANVPLQDGERAAHELRRAVTELDMVGAEIATSVDGRELDDADLEPFWAAAEELRCLLVLHPDQVLPGRPEPRYFLNNLVGNAAETTIALTHLLFSGVLTRHPDLRIVLVHGGGYLPWQAGRLDHGSTAAARVTSEHLDAPPSTYLRRLYYDTVTHSPQALRFLLDFAGAGQVVLGSDYPFEMGEDDPVGLVDAVEGLDADARAAILTGNVERLLGELRA